MAVDSETYMAVCGEVQDLRQQLTKREARVAELEAKAMQVGIDYSQAFILRKQAEAVERLKDGALGMLVDENMQAYVEMEVIGDYAQRLRQQADEAERTGGDHD